MTNKKFWLTILSAWIVFIGIDFFFHASLLAKLWNEEMVAFKSAKNLFILIPVGYLSFLLLTTLIGFVFVRIFKETPQRNEAMKFAIIFASLYSIGNFCALFSFVDVPLLHLVIFHVVYFIEICAVIFVFYHSLIGYSTKKMIIHSLVSFFVLVFSGVVIQNLI